MKEILNNISKTVKLVKRNRFKRIHTATTPGRQPTIITHTLIKNLG